MLAHTFQLAPLARPVALHPRARRAYGLDDLAFAEAGKVVQTLDGTIVRVRDDGGLDELNSVPRRWSISADPAATAAGT
jgi:hypothetical protein